MAILGSYANSLPSMNTLNLGCRLQNSFINSGLVLFTVFALSACGGSGNSKDKVNASVVPVVAGEFNLKGTSCSDGSSVVSFHDMIDAGINGFRKNFQDHFSTKRAELEKELDSKLERLAGLQDEFAHDPADENLQSAINQEQEEIDLLKEAIVYLPTNSDSPLREVISIPDEASSVEVLAKMLQTDDSDWSMKLCNYLGMDQDWPDADSIGDSDYSFQNRPAFFVNTYWYKLQMSLEQEMGLSALRSPASLASGVEYRMAYSRDPIIAEPKDPIVQQIFQELYGEAKDLVNTEIRGELNRSLNLDPGLQSEIKTILNDRNNPKSIYLDSGENLKRSTKEEFLEYAATEKIQTYLQFVDNDVWLVSKNSRNACEQRFPIQAEYLEGNIVNFRPSVSNLAYCSDSCGPVEKEVCNGFSAEVRFIHELMQRTEMTKEQANAFFNQDAKTVSFRFNLIADAAHPDKQDLILVRVSNLKKEPARVDATKSLRIMTGGDAGVCPDGLETGFFFTPKLEFTGDKAQAKN